MLTSARILEAIKRGEADTYPVLKPMNIEHIIRDKSSEPGPKVRISFEKYDPSSGKTGYKVVRTPINEDYPK